MRVVVIAAATVFLVAVVLAVLQGEPELIEKAGGIIALVSGAGAVKVYFDTRAAVVAETQLHDLQEYVSAERAEDIAEGFRRKDLMVQLTLIGISAMGSAVQPFSNEIVALGQGIARLFGLA
jgi:hypothetical protein